MAGFPVVRFEAVAFRPLAFPFVPRFKRWCASAPSSSGLLRASSLALSAVCMLGFIKPSPQACRRNHQVPRVPLPDVGVTSIRETCSASSKDITPRSSLLQTHSSIPCSSPLLRPLASFVESSQVATSPCCYRDSPDVISANPSAYAWSRTPTGPTECIYLFLALCHRPSPCRNWVGFLLCSANTIFHGMFFELQNFL